MKILRESHPRAKKQYRDEAWYWINQNGEPGSFTPKEKTVYAQSDGMIHPGQRYVYQVIADTNDFWVFRASQYFHELCLKYHLYRDD